MPIWKATVDHMVHSEGSFVCLQAVNMDVYDQSGTKEEEENGSRGDNFYTLVQGEQEVSIGVNIFIEDVRCI